MIEIQRAVYSFRDFNLLEGCIKNFLDKLSLSEKTINIRTNLANFMANLTTNTISLYNFNGSGSLTIKCLE